MPNTIGTAYIKIQPNTKGIAGSISSALNGEADSAGASAGAKLSSALGGAAKIGVAAIAGATAAVTAFGASAVKAGMNFESSMSQVAATMGYSTEELADNTSEASKSMKQLSDFAKQMGSTTAFSASESAEALNYMALAGYDAQTSISMLPTVLNLAAAGGIDLASASDMVTDAQSALGLSLEETTVMVDQMAAASSKSNTSVAQLGEAFLTIGATAKNLSGGTTELSTALGILADNGIKGAEGGTHLRNILLALNPTTKSAKEAWEELGISAYDADGSLKPLNETFAELNNAMVGMTDQEKQNILTKMFNKTDLSSINAMLGTSAERWDQLSDAIENSSGAAENMAEVQLDNLEGDITLFKSALEGAQIAVSEGLSPALREFVQFGSEGLSEITEAFSEGGFEGAMDKVGELLGELTNKISNMLPGLIDAGAKLLSGFAKGITSNLPQLTQSAIDIVTTIGKYLLESVPMLIESAGEIILTLGKGLGDALPDLVPSVVDIILGIVSTFLDNIDKIIDGAIALMEGLATGLIDAIPVIIEKAPEIIGKLVLAIIRNVPKILEASRKIIVTLKDGIIDAIPRLNDAIKQLNKNLIEWIIKVIPKMLEKGKEILLSLKEGIENKISTLKQKMLEIAEKIVEWFKIGEKMKDVGLNIIKGLWNGINNAKDWLLDKISGFVDGVVGGIKDFFGIHSPSKVMAEEVGKYLPEGMAVGITANADSVIAAMDDVSKDVIVAGRITSSNLGNMSYNENSDKSMEDIMFKAFSKALDSHKIKFNDRELGRLVRQYG